MEPVDVVIGIMIRGGQVLICRRRAADALGGYWEFPGGKREAGESSEQCLAREFREELAIEIEVLEPLAPIEHPYSTALIRLHPYLCRPAGGNPQPLACDEMRWIEPADLPRYQFPPANNGLIRDLVARFAGADD